MSSIVAKRRELTRQSIQLNPATITLIRVGKTPDGAGGWIEGAVELEPQTMRLYIGSRSTRDLAETGGQMQFNEWGLLAEHDADIQRGDTFELGGKKYRVEKVDPVGFLGEVVSIQVTVVEVV